MSAPRHDVGCQAAGAGAGVGQREPQQDAVPEAGIGSSRPGAGLAGVQRFGVRSPAAPAPFARPLPPRASSQRAWMGQWPPAVPHSLGRRRAAGLGKGFPKVQPVSGWMEVKSRSGAGRWGWFRHCRGELSLAISPSMLVTMQWCGSLYTGVGHRMLVRVIMHHHQSRCSSLGCDGPVCVVIPRCGS